MNPVLAFLIREITSKKFSNAPKKDLCIWAVLRAADGLPAERVTVPNLDASSRRSTL